MDSEAVPIKVFSDELRSDFFEVKDSLLNRALKTEAFSEARFVPLRGWISSCDGNCVPSMVELDSSGSCLGQNGVVQAVGYWSRSCFLH